MGTKKLVILLIILFSVTSCTSEVLKGNGNETDERVSISLKILFGKETDSRAGEEWEYADYFPGITEEEQRVENILLVVFKNTVLEEYDFYNGNFNQDPTDFSIVLEKDEGEDLLNLEPGPHYFYVLLNLNPELENRILTLLRDKEGVLEKSDFETQILEYSLNTLTNDKKLFIMTNSDSPPLRGIYSHDQLVANGGLNNSVQVKAGRAVGKISFAYVASEVETGELYGGLTEISYTVLNNPAKMYLMPVMENNLLITPHYNNTSYPAGYFSPTAKDAAILEDDFPWLKATTKSTINNPDKDFDYCIENHNRNTKKSNSTMVLIKAKFNPAVWMNPDATIDGLSGTPTIDGSFYRIGQYNKNDQLYGYLRGYYNADPIHVLDSLNNPNIGNKPTAGTYKSVEYPKGITYYGFWPTTDEKHQTKRNTYFQIAITHIHGAGEPTPGGTIDPDVDPDDDATWGRLSVRAIRWEEENRIVIVGEEPNENTGGIDPNVKGWEEEEHNKDLEGGDENNKFD